MAEPSPDPDPLAPVRALLGDPVWTTEHDGQTWVWWLCGYAQLLGRGPTEAEAIERATARAREIAGAGR